MFCPECGQQIADDSRFCRSCGADIERQGQAPVPAPPAPPAPPMTGMNSAPAAQPPTPGRPARQPRRAKRIIILAAVIVLVGLAAWGALTFVRNSFPLKASVVAVTATNTTSGTLEAFNLRIHANQMISKVSYAVNPADPAAEAGFAEVEVGRFKQDADVTLPDITLAPGDSELYVRVTTVFNQTFDQKIKLNYEIGYTSAPLDYALIPISDSEQLVANELLVVFRDDAGAKAIRDLIGTYGGEIVGQLYFMDQYQIRFTDYGEAYIQDLKARLEQEPLVEAVYYNLAITTLVEAVPDDPNYDSWDAEAPAGNNWGLECIDAPGAWEYDSQMSNVKVGLIDAPLQYSHEDLMVDASKVSILPTDDFRNLGDLLKYYQKYLDSHVCIDDNCAFCGLNEHGTHCAGVIGAAANNDKGVCGVNWHADLNFTTAWYYTAPSEGQLEQSFTLQGLNYDIARLVMSGCRVVSMSFGSSYPSAVTDYELSNAACFDDLIARLEAANYDFVLVKSAGNEDDDAANYMLNRLMTTGEHADAHTIIVAASSNYSSIVNRLASWSGDSEKIYNIAYYSNIGSIVDIAAPGSDIYSTVGDNQYGNMSGTSMATPMVAGVASLLYSIDADLTYDTVKTIVCNTSKNYCAKDGSLYGIVNARNAVDWVVAHQDATPEPQVPVMGFVTGLVQDAATLQLLPETAVLATEETTGAAFESMASNGQYELFLPPGTYTLQFAAAGYITENIYHVTITEGVVSYNVLLNMVVDSGSTGIAGGYVVNAFDASTIPNAIIQVFAGVNQTQGTPVLTVQADASGFYAFEAMPGNYTVLVSAEGYLPGQASVLVLPAETRSYQDCSLTPILNAGEMRVVLTWGDSPADLDSHLTGPGPDGLPFHVFYDRKVNYYGDAIYSNLDVDDTTSYGPETTSVYIPVSGTYTFFIHDYSNRELSFSNAMSLSGCQVKLYIAGQSAPLIFNVPNQDGTLWTVFSITDGVLTPINTMGYQSSPSAVGGVG